MTAYPGTTSVDRVIAMLNNEYIVVGDEAAGPSTLDYGTPLRGRGTVTSVATTANGAQLRWDYMGASLDSWTVSPNPLSLMMTAGFYASAYGSEEDIQGVQFEQSSTSPRLLQVLQPRASTASSLVVQPLATAPGASAFSVTDGTGTDTLVFAPAGSMTTTGALTSDALLAAVRQESGALTSSVSRTARA